MKYIQITYHKMPTGFGKPTTETLDGVLFDNGKIAYLDSEGAVLASENEESLKGSSI